MAINTSFLIAAPMLQDLLVDPSTSLPLAAGTVTLYSNTNKMALKNWYYQTGSFGAYTYATLDNPLTLSAGGTIVDPSGNDVIPFFYPYVDTNTNGAYTSEVYYIVVKNSSGQQMFTRENFPFIPPTQSNDDVPTLKNLIVNNEFWRNQGTVTLTNPPATKSYFPSGFTYATTLAPSQHDGFLMPNFQFIKNIQGATETCTFSQFSLGNNPLSNDITPEFYINHHATSGQVGETFKVYQFPVALHIRNLENVSATATIQLQNNGGSATTINLYIYQFLGTGVTSPAPLQIGTVTLSAGTTNWTKYTFNFSFQNGLGASLSTANDDAYYFQIGLPTNTECNFNFCKPAIFLGSTVPTDDFSTYDEIDSIINSPHTGDIVKTIRNYYDAGWVMANNGTIGNSSSNATTRANGDTWQLYNIIWNNLSSVSISYAPIYGSDGSISTLSADAYTDFTTNKQLTISTILGQVVAGTVPTFPASQPFTVTTSPSVVTLTGGSVTVLNAGLNNYSPIIFIPDGGSTLPAPLVVSTVYYCVYQTALSLTTNEFKVALSIDDLAAGNYITFSDTGTGTFKVRLWPIPTGQFQGQQKHVLTVAELATHDHTYTLDLASSGGSSPNVAFGNNSSTPTSYTTDTNGNSVAHNIMQPTTYLNTFIKL